MTTAKTIPCWSTPIILANFGADAAPLNKDLITDILREAEENDASATRSGLFAWQSKGGLEKKYASFGTLAENIEATAFAVMPKLGFVGQDLKECFQVEELWANIQMKPGAFHIPHIHGSGETLFSGVYYPTTGFHYEEDGTLKPIHEKEDLEQDAEFLANSNPRPGDLMLFDPASSVKRQVIPEWVQRYPFYGSEFTLTPRQSQLIIFPNYIEHMVAPLTEANLMRMSISFCLTKRLQVRND